MITTVCAGSRGWAAEPADCPDRSVAPRKETTTERRLRRAFGERPLPAAPADAPTFLRAEEIEAIGRDRYLATGSVELIRANQRLTSDALTYDRQRDTAESPGPATLENDLGDRYRSESITLAVGSRTGHGSASTFLLGDELGRGHAESVEFEGENMTRLKKARFTTCRPGEDDWFLKAAELELDHADETGTAWHTVFEFKGIPFFYLPYVSFPITERRRSGFLFPEIGNSDSSGFMLATPYYIDIAPNLDDTLTPRYLSRRGWQLENEVRYLTRSSRGTLEGAFLPDDEQTGTDRAAWQVVHSSNFGARWAARIDARRVSDNDYLDDFGGSLAITSQSHLPQTGQLIYQDRRLRFLAEASAYQTVDSDIAPTDRPFAMLPALTLNSDTLARANEINFPSVLQWVNFDRDEGVIGKRTYFNPAISLPLRNSYGFLTPKVLGWRVSYDLERGPDTPPPFPLPDQRPSLSLAGYSLDAGLLFDRQTAWFGRRYTQTLEPRLFFAYIPFEAQDDLPVFDTALRDLTFPALFRENRYTGGDRVGDTKQATVGLSTRFIDRELGMERLRLSIGETYYAEDRRVVLPGAAGPETDDRSGVVAEAASWIGDGWYGRATVRYAPQSWDTEQTTLFLQYNPRPDRIISLGYSYAADQLQQINSGIEWPFTSSWRVRAAQAYSIREQENLETYGGLEYRSCCWAFMVSGRRYRRSNGEQENSVMLQLELIGMSRLGSAPRSPLGDSMFFPERLLPGGSESTVRY